MSLDRDNKNRQEWTDDNRAGWTKERGKRDDRFDFAAFLGPESLEDRVTDALDGKDLLDKEAYGEYAPDYVPRRNGGGGQRGRHEAPGADPEEEQPEEEPFDDFQEEEPVKQRPVYRDEPPPRPKVVVADPAYANGGRANYGGGSEPPRRRGGGMKWLVSILLAAAVIVGAVALLPGLLFGGDGPEQPPEPTPTDFLAGLLGPQNTPQPAPTTAPTPVPTAVPTPTPVHYSVNVTAGSGGRVSPSGSVSVEEGGSVTFQITPNEGYELAQLIVDGSNVSVQSTYTFSDVRQNHTIYAVFQAVQAAPPVTEEPVVTPEPTNEPAPAPDPVEDPIAPPVAG